jgi:endonuclease/exonuclease/phosphatase family metal-dependent hydrolase
MKLLQLNMWSGRLDQQVLDLIVRTNPDVVCLQEAIDAPGNTNSMFLTVSQISRSTELKHKYMSPTWSFRFMKGIADYGNCILSKIPFDSTDTIFTGGVYNGDYDDDHDDYNIRNLQHVIVHVDGRPLHILNHHGHWTRTEKRGDDETMRQCRVIAEYIRGIDGDVVLTGDFNLAPHSESLAQINQVLTNQSIVNNLQTTRNWLVSSTAVCDYIFTSPELQVAQFEMCKEIVSDHQALVVEISL